jgi:multidrug resistance efflux pump
VENTSGSFTVRRIEMAKKQVRSVLQDMAERLRNLKESISQFEGVREGLVEYVAAIRAELMEAEAHLRDTEIFLNAHRQKLNADAMDMHRLIDNAIGRNGERIPF